ncbi:MAG: type IV conjugative transfer system protein TraE [Rickettsiales bacterium]|jgi:type IV conjugative transfer system protein TraE
MDKDNYKNNILNTTRQRNLLLFLVVILVVTNLLLTLKVVSKDVKTIILPSKISGKYQFVNGKIDERFLKDKASEVIKIILNVTPDNFNKTYANILSVIPAKDHDKVKNALKSIVDAIENRLSIAFIPIEIVVNKDDLSANIKGEQHVLFGGTDRKSTEEYYLKFTYSWSDHDLYLTDFYKIENKNNKTK